MFAVFNIKAEDGIIVVSYIFLVLPIVVDWVLENHSWQFPWLSGLSGHNQLTIILYFFLLAAYTVVTCSRQPSDSEIYHDTVPVVIKRIAKGNTYDTSSLVINNSSGISFMLTLVKSRDLTLN